MCAGGCGAFQEAVVRLIEEGDVVVFDMLLLHFLTVLLFEVCVFG